MHYSHGTDAQHIPSSGVSGFLPVVQWKPAGLAEIHTVIPSALRV
jgi:hypothetical protein